MFGWKTTRLNLHEKEGLLENLQNWEILLRLTCMYRFSLESTQFIMNLFHVHVWPFLNTEPVSVYKVDLWKVWYPDLKEWWELKVTLICALLILFTSCMGQWVARSIKYGVLTIVKHLHTRLVNFECLSKQQRNWLRHLTQLVSVNSAMLNEYQLILGTSR